MLKSSKRTIASYLGLLALVREAFRLLELGSSSSNRAHQHLLSFQCLPSRGLSPEREF
jgi:hypothetical protein